MHWSDGTFVLILLVPTGRWAGAARVAPHHGERCLSHIGEIPNHRGRSSRTAGSLEETPRNEPRTVMINLAVLGDFPLVYRSGTKDLLAFSR